MLLYRLSPQSIVDRVADEDPIAKRHLRQNDDVWADGADVIREGRPRTFLELSFVGELADGNSHGLIQGVIAHLTAPPVPSRPAPLWRRGVCSASTSALCPIAAQR